MAKPDIKETPNLSRKRKKASIFDKLEPLNAHLLEITTKLWKPSSELAINKFIVRFTGRAKEIMIILSKPILTGIKGWAITDEGFVLKWYWHVKGKGPQGVPKKLAKLNLTAAVMPALLNTLPKPPQSNNTNAPYGVILDNLFISTKLVEHLLAHSYGIRGTANLKEGIHANLAAKKRMDDRTDCEPWGITKMRFIVNRKVCQLMWKNNSLCLFLLNMEDGTETIITKRHRLNTSIKHSKLAHKPFSD